MSYKNNAQRKAVWASRNERGESPNKFKLRYRNVEKGYDPINEVEDAGYKRVEINRGNKTIVKEKYVDDTGRRRKLKTKYEGYSNIFSDKPDVVISKKFVAKGGGQGRYVDYFDGANDSPAKVRKTKEGLALKRWFKEEWTDEKGNECGSAKNKNIKKCRPSKKISKDTVKTWGEMSSTEKSKAIAEKKRVGMGNRASNIK